MTRSQPQSGFSDEELMAFADGELDDETTIRIEAALEHDDGLMARIALFMETRALAQDALRPMLDEPVPDALRAAVQSMVEKHEQNRLKESASPEGMVNETSVVPFRQKSDHSSPRNWFSEVRTMAVAAMLLAAVTGVSGYFLGSNGGQQTDHAGNVLAILASNEVHEQLKNTASGRSVALGRDNATMNLTASFRDGEKNLCREFSVNTTGKSGYVAVSCYEQEDWKLRFALASQQDEQSYVPASAQETVDQFLSSINAGAPLSADEERAALKQ